MSIEYGLYNYEQIDPPEYPEVEPLAKCDECGESITRVDDGFMVRDIVLCYDCWNDMNEDFYHCYGCGGE